MDVTTCDCREVALVCRECGADRRVVEQCQRCGKQVRVLKKMTIIARGIWPNRLPSWDEELPRKWSEHVSAQWKASYEKERAERDAEFWKRYDAHLASPAWQELRRKVFLRCKGVCEGCAVRPAVQVHHLTYVRLGHEMLFDLVGICLPCHESIHGRPIGEQDDPF